MNVIKKNLKIVLFFAIGGLLLSSCEKEGEIVKISADPVAPTLLGPIAPSGMEFVKADANNMIEYVWSSAEFGFDASVAYVVELALTDTFEGKADLASSGELTGSAKVADINSVLLAWDLVIGETSTVKCRVKATINDNVEPIYSEVVDFTVTPYETLIDYPMIYVPGSYQGWAPGDINGRLFGYDFGSVYGGILRVIDPADDAADVYFKVSPAPDWGDPNYGGALTQTGNDYSGTLDASGGDFKVAPGVYEFIVDIDALTLQLKKTNDWGMIGSAVPPFDWSIDVDMMYNGQRQMWEYTGDLNAGELKFRADNAWDLNLGDSGADGSLDEGGDNIVIAEAGNYTIRLDRINNTYQILKN